MVGGGALGNLTQLGNDSVAFGIGRQQAQDSWNYWKKSLLKGPRYQMLGLERAGLNPILAAGGGVGATTAGAQIKAGGTSGSKSANPALDQAMIAQATNAAGLSGEQGRLVGIQADAAGLRLDYDRTPEGQQTIRDSKMNEAHPNTPAGIGSKWLRSQSQTNAFEGFLNDMRPYMGKPRGGLWREHKPRKRIYPYEAGTVEFHGQPGK